MIEQKNIILYREDKFKTFQLDLTTALRGGENVLEIEVANLWPNRLIGDQRLPPEKRIAWTTRNPYRRDSPLLPSGLIGPVRILSARQPDDRKVM